MSSSSDRALVLRRYPFSETSLVVHVITREHGRVHLLARGAYRAKSRLFAVLDLFDELALEWNGSPTRELKNLQTAEISVRRQEIPRELERYRVGIAMLELAELGSHPGQAEPELFDELTSSLDSLAAGEAPPELERVCFELAFLQRHGLSPSLVGCAACGKPAPPRPGLPPRAWFSAGAGGRLCESCAAQARASGRRVGTLPLDVLVAADKICVARARGEAPPRPNPERLTRVRDFVERFLDYHLETRPRSHREFLSAPNRNAPKPPAAAGD